MATPTIDFKRTPDDAIKEILLRFPCSASVACAVFFSWHLRDIVSNKDFLSLFRQRRPSSPLLGIFASSDEGRLPVFENVSSDAILNGVVCRADTGLAYLDKDKDWLLEDCLNGRLLLCSDDSSFCIYDPLSQRRVDCGSRPYDDEGDYLNSCFVEVGGRLSPHTVSVQQRGQSTEAVESFRVISLQRRRRKPEVRAVEYDSGKLEWRPHPWKKLAELKQIGEAMHAAGHIFWKYSAAFLLVLDTSTMSFSLEPLPRKLALAPLAIGELEDGKGCAVCLQGLNTRDTGGTMDLQPQARLQVWTIEKKRKEKEECIFDWQMKKEVLVSKILDKDAQLQYAVTKVVNGLVVTCNSYTYDHYVINLHSMTQVAKFNNRGRRMAYMYQLPWPPSVLAGATTVISSFRRVPTMPSIHNTYTAGDEVSNHCPSNNKDGPATAEERHIAGGEESKQFPIDNKDGPATIDERYPLITESFSDVMQSMDKLNLRENSPEAIVSTTGEMMEQHQSLQDGYPLNMSEPNKRYACHAGGCGKSYTRKCDLDPHVKGSHPEIKPFICRFSGCGKTFYDEDKWHKHEESNAPEHMKGVFCELVEQRPHPHSGGQNTGAHHLLGDVYATELTSTVHDNDPAQMGKRTRKTSTRYSEEDYILQ